FSPFALLAGVLSVLMLVMHGAVVLAWRTEGAVAARSRQVGRIVALLTAALFAAGGFWVAGGLDGQVVTSTVNPMAGSDPTLKTVAIQAGAWMLNFEKWPLAWIAPAMGVGGAVLVALLLTVRVHWLTFIVSSLAIAGVILTVGFALFPFLMPSSTAPNLGLTIWDASSSHLTLWIMLLAVAFFLPIITLYTAWVY